MSEQDDLLAKAQAIQQQKLNSPDGDLLKQAQAIQSKKMTAEVPEEKPKWSKGESFGQGALQGASGGFSDEIGGAEGALMEKILPGGNQDNKSLEDLYKEYRDMHRGRNEEAAKNSAAYLGGNIAGGIVPAIAAGPGLAAQTALGASVGAGASNADNIKDLTKDTTIGAGMGLAGGVVGRAASGALNPTSMEVAGSKLASSAVGLKPSKELTSIYNPSTGKMESGSDVIKGIGKTAIEEKALPSVGGANAIYDKTLEAIDNNEGKLSPLLNQAQQSLDPVKEQVLDKVGHIGDKVGKFMYDFQDTIPMTSQSEGLARKLYKTYAPQIQALSDADGNLEALNTFKREAQAGAKRLNKGIYTSPTSQNDATEAQFLSRIGGIIREHIEDLANASNPDSQLGDAIKQQNKTLSNLYTYEDAAKKFIDSSKSQPKIGMGLSAGAGLGFKMGGPLGAVLGGGTQYGIEKATGQPLAQTAKIAAAKALVGGSKALSTPMGELVQKAAPAAPAASSVITNPYAEEIVQDKFPSDNQRLSAYVNNATDDSLKEVAENMTHSPVLNDSATQLKNAIDNHDEYAKRAALMKLMQMPSFRELMKTKGGQ